MTSRAHNGSAPPDAAGARWRGAGSTWTLELVGDWRGSRQPLPAAPSGVRGGVLVDATQLRAWDARLASALWRGLKALHHEGIKPDLAGLPAGLQQILSLALPPPDATAPAPLRQQRHRGWLHALGRRATAAWQGCIVTFEFFGQVLLALGRLLRGRAAMRVSDLLWQLEQCGPRSLPIVALVSFLVGLILAYQGAEQLERFGAQTYIAELVTVGVVREIGALLAGIILSGRIGAAFAAQIGSMRANEEVDALRTLGVDPVDHLVLPRVLALLLAAPLLTTFAAVVGMLVGWLVAVGLYDVTPLEYLHSSLSALTLAHVSVGLIKGTTYGVLVGLAGCRQGLTAGRSAQDVGDATTAAVVHGIVWIVIAASTLTVVFQRLGW